MKIIAIAVIALIMIFPAPDTSSAADKLPVARWSFDDNSETGTRETAGNTFDKIDGFHRFVDGVIKNGLRFDGYSTTVIRSAAKAPQLHGDFTVQAWVALETYPWSWCAIINQEQNEQAGYYFAIDPEGRFGLHLAIDGKWQACSTQVKLPLYKWNHLAGSYSSKNGISLFLNGINVGNLQCNGSPTFAGQIDLLIGRNNTPRALSNGWRHSLVYFSLDGIIDEAKIFNCALTENDILAEYMTNRPEADTPLMPAALPGGPVGPGRFGAYYTRLNYREEWENPWRVGGHADVLVRFDEAPYRFIFWRGTSYIPCWVTENGIWYTNEFYETRTVDMPTIAEPMADKQTRYSHVRILENHDARVVIHWRYSPVDVHYRHAHIDEKTEWGDWIDEYYTIYPDGTGIRKIVAWSSNPTVRPGEGPGTGGFREFQEAIVINPPGTRPEDNISNEALSLANMNGESRTYSWLSSDPVKNVNDLGKDKAANLSKWHSSPNQTWLTDPEDANISMINLKSRYNPFLIVTPTGTVINKWQSGRNAPSIFTWYNHWPAARIKSVARRATIPDKISSSSLSNVIWPAYEVTGNNLTKIMLHGMTEKPVSELVPLAKSWLDAPKIVIIEGELKNHIYDRTQKAYHLKLNSNKLPEKLTFSIDASENSPIVNPVFLVEGWGEFGVELEIDGEKVSGRNRFRVGHRNNIDSTDLVVWIRINSDRPVKIALKPVKE